MKKYSLLTLIFVLIPLICFAQETKTISLKDGSVIKGKIIGLKDNAYTVQTSELGTIAISDSKVESITSDGPINSGASSTMSNPQISGQAQQMQAKILADPQMMNEMQKLMADKEVMAIITDKNFMNDVLSYDPKRIENNQKTQDLLKNPKIQELINKINQKSSSEKQNP